MHRIDAVSLYGSSLCQGTDDGDEIPLAKPGSRFNQSDVYAISEATAFEVHRQAWVNFTRTSEYQQLPADVQQIVQDHIRSREMARDQTLAMLKSKGINNMQALDRARADLGLKPLNYFTSGQPLTELTKFPREPKVVDGTLRNGGTTETSRRPSGPRSRLGVPDPKDALPRFDLPDGVPRSIQGVSQEEWRRSMGGGEKPLGQRLRDGWNNLWQKK